VETVNRVVEQLLQRGYVPRGWIGAAMQPVRFDAATRRRLQREGGLLLLSIEPDAPAAAAGLLVGDVIVAINGERVDHPEQLRDRLDGDAVGRSLQLELARGGAIVASDVVIGERPRSGQ
jgi:S1-C subfamily serine protease